MAENHALVVLKRLAELAARANNSPDAIAMADVFDDDDDADEWLEAWNMARAVLDKA